MSDGMMRAVRAHDFGGPEVLNLEEAPRPKPGEGQVLLRMHAAGVNPADWKMRAGLYKSFQSLPMPWMPGLEGAGVVDLLGAGVSQFQVGQAVFGFISGAYAEFAAAPVENLQAKPAQLTFEEAAAVPVGSLTAWGALIDTAQVQAGQRVLVHGAAGGVGLFVVQLARWKGAHVIGTASTGNVEFVRSLGAEEVIDYHKTSFESAVHDVDIVIDTVGGDLPERSLKVLRPGGILVTVATRLDPAMGKAQGVRATGAGRAGAGTLGQIVQLIEAGRIKPVVGKVFPLEQAAQAQELSQTGHGRGRIILRIAA
jgi:NADPH:quinone reductase-like Zn-dependent oxidoreductase